MKIEELQCPSCGAKLSIDQKNPKMAVCEYCNSQYAIEWDKEQAYFNKGTSPQIPKEVRTDKNTGWEYYGWKRVLLVGAVGVAVTLLSRGPAVFDRWKMDNDPAVRTQSQYNVDFYSQDIGQSAALWEEEPGEVTLTGNLGELAALIFDCSMEEVSAEDLGKVKWLEMKYIGGLDEDVKLIGYSFDDPLTEGAELNLSLIHI